MSYADANRSFHSVLILDAKYRTVAKFGQGNKNCLHTYNYLNIHNNQAISGDTNNKSVTKLSDAKLNALYSASNDSHDANTSKQNCDIWMQYAGINDNYYSNIGAVVGVPAVEHCRNITVTIDGQVINCDLPNINVLRRIYIERNYIDELDETADDSAYKQYALGYKNPKGEWFFSGTNAANRSLSFMWSSTASIYTPGASDPYIRYYTMLVNNLGNCHLCDRNAYIFGVIPIIELDYIL